MSENIRNHLILRLSPIRYRLLDQQIEIAKKKFTHGLSFDEKRQLAYVVAQLESIDEAVQTLTIDQLSEFVAATEIEFSKDVLS